jgi:membrane-bound lytic murein transglycosylase MltF
MVGLGFVRTALAVCIAGAIVPAGSAFAQQPSASPTVLSLQSAQPRTGDFDEMLKRRVVRILAPPSRTYFFFNRGDAVGADAELGVELEEWLNKRHPMAKPYRIRVVFLPTSRDRLLDQLRAGYGDIAIGGLTITPERRARVDFAAPWASGIREVVVTGPAAGKLQSLADLGGTDVMVRKSSSYFQHLQELNKTLARPINLVAADERLEDEDLLEMVGAGLLPLAIVDLHKAKLWATIFKGLTVRDDLTVHDGGEIAWAIRPNSPKLKAELAEFVATHGLKSDFGADIRLRYFKDGRTIKNALAADDAAKFKSLIQSFTTYGSQQSVDPLLLAAVGYQESRFSQALRSRSGAVGIMQIKPSTAREKEIAVENVAASADANIHAGTKYIRFLANKYFNDPSLDHQNRVLMAIAAYNAGPGAVQRFRDYARKNGLDPNTWFRNVEVAAAALRGYETVQYVSNIYKYFIAYSVLLPKRSETGKPAASAPK